MINSRYFFVFSFILTSIAISYFCYSYISYWETDTKKTYTSNQLLNTVSAVRSELNKFDVLPSLVAKQLDVQMLLIEPSFKHLFRVRRYLEQTNVIAGSASVLVLDKKGNAVANSNWRENETLTKENYATHSFFIKAIRGERNSGVWFGEDNGVWFYYSSPIYQREQLLGVAVVRIDVAKALENTVTREPFYLSDNEGNLVYNTLIETFDQFPKVELENIEHLLNDITFKNSNLMIFKKNGQSFLIQQVSLDDTQWNIGIVTTINAFDRARWTAAGVFSFCVLLALTIMYIREWRAKKISQQQVITAQLESELRSRHIINTAQSGLITLNEHGNITFINPLVMQQFGISLNSVINQPLSILFDQPEKFTSLKRVLDNLKSPKNINFSPLTGFEVIAKRSDRSIFPAMFSIKQMRTSPVTEYLVTLVDITKRKKLEHSLKEANDSLEDKVRRRTIALETAQKELLKIEKMAVLGRMSTAIVHEVNQPLTALRNYLAILARVKHQPELIDQPLNALNHLADNMASITRQLKTFAYTKVEQQEVVNVVSIIEEVILINKPEIEDQNINVLNIMPQAEVCVLADRVRLEQVLQNLLCNALDAMSNNTYREINIKLTSDIDNAYLSIRDNGGGIENNHLEQIFEPFFTTKEIGLGLGLGLSIVKNIITDLNGTITAQNIKDGLEFNLTLPLKTNE